MKFNEDQRRLLSDWFALLRRFVAQDWRAAVWGITASLFGVAVYEHKQQLVAQLVAMAPDSWDRKAADFFTNIRALWETLEIGAWIVAAPVALLLFIVGQNVVRVLRSWFHGMMSGTFVITAIVVGIFGIRNWPMTWRMGAEVGILAAVVVLVGFCLSLGGAVYRRRTIHIDVSSVPSAPHSVIFPDASAPIDREAQDTLGRSPFVESLALRCLARSSSVIGLRGKFGDGKSSVLNLLRRRLDGKAVVVSFSTWLPDSRDRLVLDLVNDIATEINRKFFVPDLRKSLNRFAALVTDNVSHLKVVKALVPNYTQRDEIAYLSSILARLPIKVVVLLDEIDRMQQDEIFTLLKILRGASSLPNITFVCAFHQEQVERIVLGNNTSEAREYLEKFFPISMDLPMLRPDGLKRELRQRLEACFLEAGWEEAVQTSEELGKRFNELWDAGVDRVCTNLRQISILVPIVESSAALVKDEVDPADLIAIEVMRQFYPSVHRIIWANSEVFSSSDGWWKSLKYSRPEEIEVRNQRVTAALQKAEGGASDSAIVNGLLAFMFPQVMQRIRQPPKEKQGLTSEELTDADGRRGIAHPDYFPIYFLNGVPETIFSSFEFGQLIKRICEDGTDNSRQQLLGDVFDPLDRGSVREYDFLRRMNLAVQRPSLPIEAAQSISMAVLRRDRLLADDFIFSGKIRALGIFFTTANRLAESPAVTEFLISGITDAQTHHFATRILMWLEKRHPNDILKNYDHVNMTAIRAAWVDRLDAAFDGRPVHEVEIVQMDVWPLYQWAIIDEAERAKVSEFWTRFIGESRCMLGRAFELIAPKGTLWDTNSGMFVDTLLPRQRWKTLYETLIQTTGCSDQETLALTRLSEYLDDKLVPGQVLH